jgi:hypothetical protein
LPALVALTAFVCLFVGVISAWLAYGRQAIRAQQLLAIPRYVLWKIPLYFTFLTRGRHATWERTERGPGNREP